MSTAPNTTERCTDCGRNPRTINSDMSECALVECPHRPRAWSDGTEVRCYGNGAGRPQRGPGEPFDRLFDPVKD